MLEVHARIVAACMTELNIKEVDGHPSPDILPTNLSSASKKEKLHFLKLLATKVVDKYVLDEQKVTALLNKVQMAAVEEKEKMNTEDGRRFKCRFEDLSV